MAEKKSEKTIQELPELNVGIVGHIDHGKTTLLDRLSGKIADTHSEELKRGITIKLGYADMTVYNCSGTYKPEKQLTDQESKDEKCKPEKYVSFIDAPGHEMLMATMLSGAAIMDAAILVVAANEGIKPQTREHFMALQAKQIRNIIIVQNKIDTVSKEDAKKNYQEIKKFLKGTQAEDAPIIPVSAQQGVNVDKVLEILSNTETPERDTESNPVFLVARSFDINKPGTSLENVKGGVLGGILKKGTLKKGQEIEIKPGISVKKQNQQTYQPLKTKIRSLHKGQKEVDEVYPGASVSIETSLDPQLTKTDSLIGCVVSNEGCLPETTKSLRVKYNLFNEVYGESGHQKVEDIKTKELLMLNVNTTITVGTVEKIESSEGSDKNDKEIEMSLTIPVVGLKNDIVGIARNIHSHWRLIGYGEVIQ